MNMNEIYNYKIKKYKSKIKKINQLDHNNTNQYKFLFFDIKKELDKQIEYIDDHLFQIISIYVTSFPANYYWMNNINNLRENISRAGEAEIEYIFKIREMIDEIKGINQFYFVVLEWQVPEISETYYTEVIGCCWIGIDSVVPIFDNYEPYLPVFDARFESDSKYTDGKEIAPVIVGLCKNQAAKGVGKFLLDKVCDNLKNAYRKVYLVVRDGKSSDNYASMLGPHVCGPFTIEDMAKKNPKREAWEKYKKTNLALVDYYKRNGFNVEKNKYVVEYCTCGGFYEGQMYYIVMSRNL